MDKEKTAKVLRLLINEEDEGITRCFHSPEYACDDIYSKINKKDNVLKKDFDNYLDAMQKDDLIEIDGSTKKNVHATERGLKYFLSNNLGQTVEG